jgi:DNA-binding beta-propeller fold protein YncE
MHMPNLIPVSLLVLTLSIPTLFPGHLPGREDRPEAGAEPLSPGGIRIEELSGSFGEGELREPLAVTVDQRGRIYAADAMTGKIYRFSPDGGSVEFEGSSAATTLYPLDLGVEGSMVYVLDYADNRVLRYEASGAFLDIFLSFDEFPKMRPVSFTVGEGGRFLTTDIENHSVTVWTPLLDIEFTVGEYGWTEGSFNEPRKAASLPDGRIAVIESGNRRLQLLSPTGTYERIIVPPEETPFLSPRWVTSDGDGNIFVADTEAGAIFVFGPEGRFLDRIDSHGGEGIIPTSAAIGWDDLLYVTDLRSKSVLAYRLHYR